MKNSFPACALLGILNLDPEVLDWALPGRCFELRSCLIFVNATKGAIAVLPQSFSFSKIFGILPRSQHLNERGFNILSAEFQVSSISVLEVDEEVLEESFEQLVSEELFEEV